MHLSITIYGVDRNTTVLFFSQSFLAHDLGLTSPFGLAKYYSAWADAKSIESSPSVRVTEASFGGVEALVFESAAAGQEQSLKRSVVYFHGGGWTVGSTSRR